MAKSNIKSKLPSLGKKADNFLDGADYASEKAAVSKTSRKKKDVVLPWEEPYVRADVTKQFTLRMKEPLFLKLRYIGEHSPQSANAFVLDVLGKAVEEKIGEMT